MSAPVTTNPIMIMFINMTVVFAVLYGLSLIIRLIKVVDQTQKKTPAATVQPVLAEIEQAAAVWSAAAAREDDDESGAVIMAAIAAIYGDSCRVLAVRPVVSRAWQQAGRIEAVCSRWPGLARK